MTSLDLIAKYSPVGDMITFIMSAVLLFLIAKVLYFNKDIKFMALEKALHLVFLAAIFNIAFKMVIKYEFGVVAILATRYIYHILLILCLHCYICYMKEMLCPKGIIVHYATILTRSFVILSIVLTLLGQFTHFGFYYQDGAWYDPVNSPYTFFYVYAIIVFFIMLANYPDRLIRSVRICLGACEAIIVVIMIYQAFLNVNSFTTFTYILPILVVLILLHSKPFDDKSGAFTGDSFESYVKRNIEKNIHMDYMILKLNMNILDHIPDELGRTLASFWHDYFKHAVLFQIDRDLFVLTIPRDKQNRNSEMKIKEVIDDRFEEEYLKYQIPYKVVGLFDIDFIENQTDITGIIRYLLQNMDENTISLVDEKTREELRMLKIIMGHLADMDKVGNLDDERVLVYCQPIKNMETGRYDTAEALMRMTIPEKKLVFPDMFIPIAEQYGYIHMLTKIILNKACRMIKQLEEEGYDFKRISINFSALEIKAEDFDEEILAIIRSNGVDPKKIGVEITETQNESDLKIVKERIAGLREQGMTIYLDDVGTGYSNIDRIVKYDVDVVKFDRFLILEAEKSEKAIVMMRHLAEAFKGMNYTLLFEGVETEANQELCMTCGAQYLQGYMYSKPIPIEDLRKFFSK